MAATRPELFAPRPCRFCGTVFAPAAGHKRRVYCSDDCNRDQNRRDYRKNRPSDSHRARARHFGVAYEPVNRLKVFERDGWRCQVCGKATPRRLLGTTKDRAPELDHRVPMALGGGHLYSNCQCACRRCNAAKAAVEVIGQMPLFERGAA